MLKGTGTRASKSRLTTFAGARESSHTTFREARKEDKKDPLALVPEETKVEGKERGEKIEILGDTSMTSFLPVLWLLACLMGEALDDVVGDNWRGKGKESWMGFEGGAPE